MNEEKRIILELLSNGKINALQAEQLLSDNKKDENVSTASINLHNSKFLKILVVEGDATKININLPIALAEAGLRLVPKDKLMINERQIDLDEILALVKAGSEGELVNIETNDHNKNVKVKIFVE